MLNEEQLQAVETFGSVCILSGAGTGKTETITSVVERRIARGANPGRVFVATFTNKAAKEMKERLESKDVYNIPWLGTFHKNSFKLMRRYGIHPGRTNHFQIAEDSALLQAVGNYILPDKKVDPEFYAKAGGSIPARKIAQEFINAVSLMKGDLLSPTDAEFHNYPENVRKIFKEFPMLEGFFPQAYARYEEMLRYLDVVDLGDLIYIPVCEAQENPDIAEVLGSLFDLVVVDEHQDSCRSQRALAHLLATDGDLVTVGDDGQSIYGWRGADVGGIREDSRAEGTTCVVLKKNYRSTPGILALGTFFVSQDEESLEKDLISSGSYRDEVHLPYVQQYFSDSEEISNVSEKISRRIKDGERPSDIAVLCRTRSLCSRMVNRLIKAGVPTVSDSLNIWESKEVRFIVAWLKMVLNPDASSNILLLNDITQSGLVKYGLGETWISKASHEIYHGAPFSDVMLGDTKKTQTFKAHYNAIQGAISENRGDMNFVLDCVETIIRETNIENEIMLKVNDLKACASVKQDGEIETLMNRMEKLKELRVLAEGEPLEEFLEQSALGNTSSSMEDAVRVQTFHSAKGLEWKVVYILGFTDGMMGTMPGDGFGEACRMAYVAVTRAKKDLHISYALSYHNKAHYISSILSKAINAGLCEMETSVMGMSYNLRRQEKSSRPTTLVIPDWMRERAGDDFIKDLRRIGGG